MKLFKYSTSSDIKKYFYGVFVFLLFCLFLMIISPILRSSSNQIVIISVVILGIIVWLVSLNIMQSGRKGLRKRIGVGEKGILLPDGKHIPWQRIENVSAVDEYDHEIRKKAIFIDYIDDSSNKKTFIVSSEKIKHYYRFAELVQEEFKKYSK